jgi:hypothetical protein
MTLVLLAPVACLLLAQGAPRPVSPPPEQAARAEADRRLSPEDEEVVRNLELLEQLELLQKLELFDAAGDADAPAPARAGDGAGPRR